MKVESMEKIIIFGAGGVGKSLYPQIRDIYGSERLLFSDNNPELWGTTLFSTTIINPNEISKLQYDRVILASLSGFETIPTRLVSAFNIPLEKIDSSLTKELFERTFNTRNRFLKRVAEIIKSKKIAGNVAEGGVFEGYFARQINALFPDKYLYLFDTFEGFDKRDLFIEKGDTRERSGHFNIGLSINSLLSSMPNPDKIILKKGYFPESVKNVNDTFAFVNLDFDLYKPTLAGLEFFYPMMAPGGIILVHDYFQDYVLSDKSLSFQGVKEAVDDFSNKHNAFYVPVGDEMSIAFIKNGSI